MHFSDVNLWVKHLEEKIIRVNHKEMKSLSFKLIKMFNDTIFRTRNSLEF